MQTLTFHDTFSLNDKDFESIANESSSPTNNFKTSFVIISNTNNNTSGSQNQIINDE